MPGLEGVVKFPKLFGKKKEEDLDEDDFDIEEIEDDFDDELQEALGTSDSKPSTPARDSKPSTQEVVAEKPAINEETIGSDDDFKIPLMKSMMTTMTMTMNMKTTMMRMKKTLLLIKRKRSSSPQSALVFCF